MRRELRGYSFSYLEKALEHLGYRRLALGGPLSLEWKRENFHVKLRERGSLVILSIHYDPPLHNVIRGTSRGKGEDIEKEYKNIIKTYKKLRVAKR